MTEFVLGVIIVGMMFTNSTRNARIKRLEQRTHTPHEMPTTPGNFVLGTLFVIVVLAIAIMFMGMGGF